jgi:hypothetical protein
MDFTIAEIYAKCVPLAGILHTLPKTANKGLPGLHLETLLGIPHTSNCLDCSDGELKTFPLKRLKNGQFAPKETIAVTMLSTDDLRACEFKDAKCYKKMRRMLLVPYYRTEDTIQFMAPKIIDGDLVEFADLYKQMETDYTEIRKAYLETGILTSTTGTLLQNRTKGAGHGSTSRAFYLRPEFMKRCMSLNS